MARPPWKPATAAAGGRAEGGRAAARAAVGPGALRGSLAEARLSERLPRPQPPGAISLSRVGDGARPRPAARPPQGRGSPAGLVPPRAVRGAPGPGACARRSVRSGGHRVPLERLCAAPLPLPPSSPPGTGFGGRHFPVSLLAAVFRVPHSAALPVRPLPPRVGAISWFPLSPARFGGVPRGIWGVLSSDLGVLRTSF